MELKFQPPPPDHVPPELIVDFDLFKVPPGVTDPAQIWTNLKKSGVPRIFYSLQNGGHWVFTEYDQITDGFRNYGVFSNHQTPVPPIEPYPVMQPQGVDPPEHKAFRSLLAPMFTPIAVRGMTHEIQRRVIALIEEFADKGHCDFVEDFADVFPTSMFLYLFGLPEDRLSDFRNLSQTFFRSTDPDVRARNITEIYQVLDALFRERQAHPGTDIASAIVAARNEDGNQHDWTDILNAGFLLFVAGLDTVTNTITLVWRYLATHPEARQFFLDNIDDSVAFQNGMEELLRINAVANIFRRVAVDCEYEGITFRKNDRVVLSGTLANRDPKIFQDPETIDLNREVNVHTTFGVGPHRCVGSHLAKREIIVALQEWLRRIPDFKLDPNMPQGDVLTGSTMGFNSLHLAWAT